MPEDTQRTNIKLIFALTMVHFIGDLYASYLNPMLPVLVKEFSLSLTQVGLLAGLSRFLAFIVQPSVGYFADHFRTRLFLLGGPFLAMVFMPLLGLAPSFLVLLIFVSLGSIGQSMFHPPAAGMVTNYGGRHFGLSMSIFNLGGTIAFGIGPLFITYIIGRYGLRASPYTMIFGLIGMIYLFIVVPMPEGEGLRKFGFFGSLKEVFGGVWKPIIVMWGIMVLRAFVGQSLQTFLPVMYAQEGFQLFSVGMLVSSFVVAGAMSGLVTGHLSDRIGYKKIFYISFALTTPCILLLLSLHGHWVFLGAFLAGFFNMATMPLGVVWAQRLAPKGKSMVSSMMMGLAFGIGGLMSPITGRLADAFSIRTVLTFMAIVPLLTLILVYFIPEKKRGEVQA